MGLISATKAISRLLEDSKETHTIEGQFGTQQKSTANPSQEFFTSIQPEEAGQEFLKNTRQYDEIRYLIDNRAAVRKADLWGFVNENGVVVIPVEYYKVDDFKFGMTIVKNKYTDKKYSLTIGWVLDKNGKKLTEGITDIIKGFRKYEYSIKDSYYPEVPKRRLEEGYTGIRFTKESRVLINHDESDYELKNDGYFH